MKIISKITIIFTLVTIIFLTYFSLVGIETDKFNNQIKSKLTSVNKNLDLELKQINLKLNPLELKINVKILGAKIKSRKEVLETESIKTKISLISFFKNEFVIKNLDISTKSINIEDLISFTKTFYNNPNIIIFEKFFQVKGFIVADLKINFDNKGNIKNNYFAKGYVKDAKLSLFKDYKLHDLNFVFKIEKDNLEIQDIEFILNDINFISDKINLKKNKQGYTLKGNLDNKLVELNNKNFALFEEKFIPDLGVEKIIFGSKNEFSFNLDKNFKISNEYILSNIDIKKFQITNNFKLKNIFPKINDKIFIENNNLKIEYNKNNLYIEGKGDIYLQNNKDYIDFKVEKKNQLINFEGLIKLDKDPFIINFLNFKKDQNYETKIKFNGYRDATKKNFSKID